MLRKNTGIVTFVGIAARFTTRDIAIAALAIAIKNVELPANIMKNTVMGVRIDPWIIMITATHKKRLSSCFLHHVRNLSANVFFASRL